MKRIGLYGFAAFMPAASCGCGRRAAAPAEAGGPPGPTAPDIAEPAPSVPPAGKAPPGAEAAIKAFVKAVRRHDLKAMAASVVGGSTDFDYGRLKRGVFFCVREDCTSIKVDGFTACTPARPARIPLGIL